MMLPSRESRCPVASRPYNRRTFRPSAPACASASPSYARWRKGAWAVCQREPCHASNVLFRGAGRGCHRPRRRGSAGQRPPCRSPGFHHLHLGATNPEAAIAFYTKAFPSISKTIWVACRRCGRPTTCWCSSRRYRPAGAATQPQTAMWHFGWHVINERAALARMRADG